MYFNPDYLVFSGCIRIFFSLFVSVNILAIKAGDQRQLKPSQLGKDQHA